MHFIINLSYTVFIYESVFPAQVLCVWYVFIIFTIYITDLPRPYFGRILQFNI